MKSPMEQLSTQKALEWATNAYINPQDRMAIQTLIDNNESAEIIECFYKDLEFGTGGLRNIIGLGSNRVNIYNVRKATQAVANVLKKTHTNKEILVCVAYDSRKFSKEFAHEVCSVFAGNNIKTKIYRELRPVPMLSYSINYYKADAGIMITASHNPRQYNGYKVYWSDSSQLTPPYDHIVINAYNDITDFNTIKYMDYTEAESKKLITFMGDEVEESYYGKLLEKSLNLKMCKESGGELKIIYTAIHGTGYKPCNEILKRMGFTSVTNIEEQAKPDSNFSTVKYPNPENPEALTLATNKMRAINGDIAMGTDPDTDRLGVVVNHQGKNEFLNGNQIGTIMLYYILENTKLQNRMPKHPLVLKTIVTSNLQDVIAKSYGVRVENTLTGFKWMGKRLAEMEEQKIPYNFLFATEESFGYLNHEYIRDKDGVCAVALMSEIALWAKKQGMTLIDLLNKIYEIFGFSYELNISIDYEGTKGSEKIDRIMEFFRNYRENQICGDTIIVREDYQAKTTTNCVTKEISPLTQPKSNVIGIHFKSNNAFYIRPSGTEPKIKFYIMIQEKSGDLKSKKEKAFSKASEIEKWIRVICDKQ